jgi:D-alanyl-D-alanine carboxypeptidase (penicillin-binding protein 5/6)
MTKVAAGKFIKRLLLVSIILVLSAEAVLYLRPLPALQPVVNIKNPVAESSIALPWPSYGQSAIGAQGFGVLETNGGQNPAPIASVAKVMTAYSVLKQKPISPGQQGPVITINDQDVLTYNDYFTKGGSVAKVSTGEQISEYQALQALMLPSANNFADTLATWAFGSMDKYILYANSQAKELGMSNTHISDASGFSPQTLSSAHDLVLLGQAAIKNPVLAEIVAQGQATIPVAGDIHNVNWLLGTDNVNGIKTGNTDAAMGCFLFSSVRSIGGNKITVIGAINASDQGFESINAVKPGQVIGYYKLPWGGRTDAVAKGALPFFVWKGDTLTLSAKLNSIKAPKDKGAVVGAVNGKTERKTDSTAVILAQPVSSPSWKWRVFGR